MMASDLDLPSLGRIVRPVDYVRVLGTPVRLRSPHFALHHLEGEPLPMKRLLPRTAAPGAQPGTAATSSAPVNASLSTELSTGERPRADGLVDGSPGRVLEQAVGVDIEGLASPDVRSSTQQLVSGLTTSTGGARRWLGLVVPKRHAKRAVTRTLVKRQIRNVVAGCAGELAPGLWVVRLRMPFDVKQYPSAASDALKEAARAELRALLERAVRGERDRFKPRPAGTDVGARKRKKGAPPLAISPDPSPSDVSAPQLPRSGSS